MKLNNLFNKKIWLLKNSHTFLSIFILLFILPFTVPSLKAQKSTLEIDEILNFLKQGYVNYTFESLRNISIKNDIKAQFYLAECYYYGIGTDMNLQESFKLYRKAAERGLPDAMNRLVMFYENGKLFQSDPNKAKEWQERYQKKGGLNILPDFIQLAKEGLNYPHNFVLNPKSSNENSSLIILQDQPLINNITIIQSISPELFGTQENLEEKPNKTSDIDLVNTIQNHPSNDKTFVLIIANENYHDVENVSNAIHDGEIFKDYCYRLLGVPEINIHFIKDATLNNIKRELNLISQISEEFKGDVNIIIYYSGHGIPDEKTKDPYIFPIDGFSADISTCYSTKDLYSKLGNLQANKVIIFLDACFSGSLRGDGMLVSARGISIKSNSQEPRGNMVIFSAAQGDETAYSFEEKGHGMFTYYLLKHLKDSNGEITLKDLAEQIEKDVRKHSLILNGKRQTPTVQYSSKIQDLWSNWKLNE